VYIVKLCTTSVLNLGQSVSLKSLSPLWINDTGTGISWAGFSSCRPSTCVQTLKETKSTEPSQGKSPAGVIVSSFSVGLLVEELSLSDACSHGEGHTMKARLPPLFCGPFSGTTQVSQCRKRTSGLYGASRD